MEWKSVVVMMVIIVLLESLDNYLGVQKSANQRTRLGTKGPVIFAEI